MLAFFEKLGKFNRNFPKNLENLPGIFQPRHAAATLQRGRTVVYIFLNDA